ncbi:MAG: hypothetical protein WAT92_23455 [Saprospiraceae bacterium]
MQIHHFNIIHALIQISLGLYGMKEGNPSVFLTVVPLLLGLVILPTQQSLQHKVKTAVRAVAIISCISLSAYVYASFRFIKSENDDSLILALCLCFSSLVTLLSAIFTLYKKA